ncbi:retrovirus-related pol polyprotein from transposon TNT 1-94 [Tanacetum coccineum]
MSTLADIMIVAGANNRPPMLDKPMYESWKSRMELYIQGKDHGQIILNSYENGPLIWPTVELENGTFRPRPKKMVLLSDKEKLQADCDLKATNIVLQGTSLSKQECKLYDEFDKFSHVKGETLYEYYLRFAQLINDMNIIQMTMQPVQLARDLHTSNYDQLYAYLKQHEAHVNEARLLRERFPDPLALVANYHQPSSHFYNYQSQYTTPQYQQQFSPPTQHVYSSLPQSNPYGAPHHSQQYPNTYPTNLSLAVLTFLPGDDSIACINKAMAFLSAVFSPRYPSTNYQLRSSSNLRNQSTVQDGRVIVQQVQGRQGQNVVGSGSQGNASGSRGNISGQVKVVKCYNCQGEGHMAREYTQPKRRRDAAWFKEKVLLVQAHAKGKELDEEQLAFLADLGVADGQVAQTLKDFFKEFDKGLHDEITEVQIVFTQVEAAAEQYIVNIVLNSSVVICDSVKKNDKSVDTCTKCPELEVEFVKKNDVYIELSKRFSNLEQHCISLEVAMQLNQGIFQKDKSCANQNAPEIQEYFEQNDLQAQLHAKDTIISNIKNVLRKLKGKNVIDTVVSKPNAITIAPKMYKLELEPLPPKVLKNKDAHIAYINHSRDHADTLRDIVKSARALSPLDSNLDSACKFYLLLIHTLNILNDVDLKLLSKQEYSHDLILAFRLEVSIQKVQGSFDKSDGSDNASQHDRSLMTYFGTINLERSISSRRTSIGSDIMLSRSNSNAGFNTPKNVKLTKDKSLQWDWINSTYESSTSTLEGTSEEDSLDAERYLLVTMVVVNTVIQDEKEFLNNIIKSNNMKCLTAP